jgi:hypothetical protein
VPVFTVLGWLKRARLVAEVDSAAVQNGFGLYLHRFIVTDELSRHKQW